MSDLVEHYINGSVNPEWIRAMVQLEDEANEGYSKAVAEEMRQLPEAA